jgi:hypothetical protein
MAYYNEQLQELQNQSARKNQVNVLLKSLYAQRDELEGKVADLEKIKLNEQADVDKLEGRSLAAFFYYVVGKKDEKLDKERREAYAAAVKYDTAAKELTGVLEQIRHLETEAFRLQNCEKRYEELLQKKADAIKAEGMPGADKIFQLEAKIAFIDNQIKEINEAISCANTAKYTTEDILSKLESAEKWGTFDIWGGGTVAGIAKHCELDDAQERVERLQIQLRKLKTELADVTIQTDIHVNVDGFLRFADYFYDGLLADCAVQDQIKQSQSQIISTQNKISDVINHLNTMLRNVESEKNLAKHQIKELVNKVEI